MLASKQGSLKDQSVGTLPRQLQEKFEANKTKVFNVLIFKELVKQIAVVLSAKEILSGLLDA